MEPSEPRELKLCLWFVYMKNGGSYNFEPNFLKNTKYLDFLNSSTISDGIFIAFILQKYSKMRHWMGTLMDVLLPWN